MKRLFFILLSLPLFASSQIDKESTVDYQIVDTIFIPVDTFHNLQIFEVYEDSIEATYTVRRFDYPLRNMDFRIELNDSTYLEIHEDYRMLVYRSGMVVIEKQYTKWQKSEIDQDKSVLIIKYLRKAKRLGIKTPDKFWNNKLIQEIK